MPTRKNIVESFPVFYHAFVIEANASSIRISVCYFMKSTELKNPVTIFIKQDFIQQRNII